MSNVSASCGHTQISRQRPTSSLSAAFRRGCSLQQRQPALRAQRCVSVSATPSDQPGQDARGQRRTPAGGDSGNSRGDEQAGADGFTERLVQVRRVTKVVKGGKQLSFRAVVVAGNGQGEVGVGCASAKEIAQAVQRAVLLAKRESVFFPLNKAYSLPHQIDGYWGAAKVMLRPAADGAGVIAGGAVRVVLELAGVRNCFGKQLGSANQLNNARATIEGLRNLRTFKMVSKQRGVSVAELMGTVQPTLSSTPVSAAMADVV